MGKIFNTTGVCRPDKHYMVNLDERLGKIEALVDQGAYFTINRARQFGKTTTIRLLREWLFDKCIVFSISFEGMEKEVYAGAVPFCKRICRLLYDEVQYGGMEGIPGKLIVRLEQMCRTEINLVDLSDFISRLCTDAEKPVVLMIDEVDQASNQEIFLSFLGMLRNKYLNRDKRLTFQSVILAGVYDIKNLKLRLRPDTERQYNSPWNIATDFTVDMSFSPEDISGMLKEYEQDEHTRMDIDAMASLLYAYTSGYPYLVSRLCKIMDERVPQEDGFGTKASAWTQAGLTEAVKILLTEPNTLFDDIVKRLADFPELKKMIYVVLFQGERIPYNVYHYAINVGCMFGFIKNHQGMVEVSNRIFETLLYNLFLSEEILDSKIYKAAALDKNQFIRNGQLDMELVLERFVVSFTEIYGDAEEAFVEENGRRFFLLYLKPIINGVGNYYIEARTRDMRRTDVIVDYRGSQYICELKIWHGQEYHQRGEQQLIGYLDDYHLTKGYMVSFNFNKKKQVGVKKIEIGGRVIVEAVV